MRINLQKYSFRFAEEVLNSKLTLKQEIESILLDPSIELQSLNRPHFNKILENLFIQKGWVVISFDDFLERFLINGNVFDGSNILTEPLVARF